MTITMVIKLEDGNEQEVRSGEFGDSFELPYLRRLSLSLACLDFTEGKPQETFALEWKTI